MIVSHIAPWSKLKSAIQRVLWRLLSLKLGVRRSGPGLRGARAGLHSHNATVMLDLCTAESCKFSCLSACVQLELCSRAMVSKLCSQNGP